MATDKSNYKNDKMTDEPLLKVLDVIPKAPCVLLFVSRMKSYEFSDFMISAEERRKRERRKGRDHHLFAIYHLGKCEARTGTQVVWFPVCSAS